MLKIGLGLATAALAISGCAAIQGTHLDAMTGVEHARAAERAATQGHPDLARAHRESAMMLEGAQREACQDALSSESGLSGLSVADVDAVYSVRGEGEPAIAGARMLVALEGRSLEQMGRILRCRAARGAVQGADADPFGLPGTSVRVSPGDAGWALLEVRTGDPVSGAQVVERARRAEQRM